MTKIAPPRRTWPIAPLPAASFLLSPVGQPSRLRCRQTIRGRPLSLPRKRNFLKMCNQTDRQTATAAAAAAAWPYHRTTESLLSSSSNRPPEIEKIRKPNEDCNVRFVVCCTIAYYINHPNCALALPIPSSILGKCAFEESYHPFVALTDDGTVRSPARTLLSSDYSCLWWEKKSCRFSET